MIFKFDTSIFGSQLVEVASEVASVIGVEEVELSKLAISWTGRRLHLTQTRSTFLAIFQDLCKIFSGNAHFHEHIVD